MSRRERERLSKAEMTELVLRLQRPEKTSRTSSKPPSRDRKERRAQAKPGGAKPGHEGHSRLISETPDAVVEHRPDRCTGCGGALQSDLPAEFVCIAERIDLPEVVPVVTRHQQLAVRYPICGTRALAPLPGVARGTPLMVSLSSHRPCACTRWQPTSRPSRRFPTSGSRRRCPTCSGSASARAD
ncbi:hypothetical protein Mnod_3166 [Methylobacterium nodulans ORS 2060]|uniref:Transposase IS66 zinc-finger binding domain-containing protein n=1 Tax=Methylobacterium nodulans (strain LMG 21967 / CNCM I-2342 / ORS 2060) TaxID=460265 RepID=B8IJP8_METNO|nr:hypothetical protein Mnod_3166 [Methylobacterium nodulans ORS 2060]